MNTQTTNTQTVENTIVAFHIGRGGQFYNAGHVTFLGCKNIGYFTSDLNLAFENAMKVWKAIGNRENLQAAYIEVMDSDNDLNLAAKFKSRTGLDLGNLVYVTDNGEVVGLTAEEESTGIGTVNIDNQYDTTFTCYLKDCSDAQLQLIADYSGYLPSDVLEYAQNTVNA
jgi:hypothetical protein